MAVNWSYSLLVVVALSNALCLGIRRGQDIDSPCPASTDSQQNTPHHPLGQRRGSHSHWFDVLACATPRLPSDLTLLEPSGPEQFGDLSTSADTRRHGVSIQCFDYSMRHGPWNIAHILDMDAADEPQNQDCGWRGPQSRCSVSEPFPIQRICD